MASSGSVVWETRKTDDNWKKIQERTFTNWFNDRLRGNLRVAKKQVCIKAGEQSPNYSDQHVT